MRILPFVLCSLLVLSSYAGQQEIIESSIRFEIKNAGVTVEGSFSQLAGTIEFDPANYPKSIVNVSVPSATINTGIGARDAKLKKAEYFDIAKFPSIRLKSRFFGKATEDNAFRGYFTLTLKGVSQDITMPFTVAKEGDHFRIKGDFTINRRDFGVGGKSFIMSDEVTLHINLLLTDGTKSLKKGSPLPPQSEHSRNIDSLNWIFLKP